MLFAYFQTLRLLSALIQSIPNRSIKKGERSFFFVNGNGCLGPVFFLPVFCPYTPGLFIDNI